MFVAAKKFFVFIHVFVNSKKAILTSKKQAAEFSKKQN
jgi:hypothetical protein